MKLQTIGHPDSNDWLSIHQAGQLLHRAGLPTRLNQTRCKRDKITVSKEGYIERASLETYIQKEQPLCQE